MRRITSLNNDRIKDVVRLQRQSSARRETGLFCIEYDRDLQRAIDHGYAIRELYHCPAVGPLPDRIPADRVVEVNESVLAKLAYRENPEGFVAVLEARSATLDDLPDQRSPLFIICSGVEKPGNVGAVLRSADAAGASAVFIDSPDYDLFNPNCIRASTGAVFGLPVVRTDRDALRDWLAERSITTIATTPDAKLTYLAMNLRPATALVVGAEAEGLDEFWLNAADLTASIPMSGRAVDSLNVSITAAVLLFEAMRQRTG
jgi:TrmH family RNA methyltransferase